MEYEEDNKKTHKKAPQAKKQQTVFAKALSTSEEYIKLLRFFGSEMPQMICKLSDDLLVANKQQVRKDTIDLSKLNNKLRNLLKAFASLYTSLLSQAITEDKASGSFLALFFGDGAATARCVMTYHNYHKKLALSLAGLVMDYTSSLDKPSMVLAFITLKALFPKKRNNAEETESMKNLYENTVKRMYNEFARVSKFGGGAINVQDKLTICQNCFVEMISTQRKVAYKLGFLYIR